MNANKCIHNFKIFQYEKNQHVVPHEKEWTVKGAGNKKRLYLHRKYY